MPWRIYALVALAFFVCSIGYDFYRGYAVGKGGIEHYGSFGFDLIMILKIFGIVTVIMCLIFGKDEY